MSDVVVGILILGVSLSALRMLALFLTVVAVLWLELDARYREHRKRFLVEAPPPIREEPARTVSGLRRSSRST